MKNEQIDILRTHPALAALAAVLPPGVITTDADGTTAWSEEVLGRFGRYVGLIEEWRVMADLVSAHDVRHLAERHIIDALSLAPHILSAGTAQSHLLDIGCGAGFPAIPLKLAIPGLQLTLIERTTRKVAFLEMVISAVGLKGVRLIHGEFPVAVPDEPPQWATARAVEKPERVSRALKGYLPAGATFLCQFSNPQALLGPMFHVEPIEDEWTRQGWRRGNLSLVRRKTEDE